MCALANPERRKLWRVERASADNGTVAAPEATGPRDEWARWPGYAWRSGATASEAQSRYWRGDAAPPGTSPRIRGPEAAPVAVVRPASRRHVRAQPARATARLGLSGYVRRVRVHGEQRLERFQAIKHFERHAGIFAIWARIRYYRARLRKRKARTWQGLLQPRPGPPGCLPERPVGTVVCDAPFVCVVFVDYRASETRASTTAGVTTTDSAVAGAGGLGDRPVHG